MMFVYDAVLVEIDRVVADVVDSSVTFADFSPSFVEEFVVFSLVAFSPLVVDRFSTYSLG